MTSSGMRSAQPNQTVPTGWRISPPPGPAMPVTETAKSAVEWISAPSAI